MAGVASAGGGNPGPPGLKPWQYAEMPNGDLIPDLTGMAFLYSGRWWVGYAEEVPTVIVFMGIFLLIGSPLIILVFDAYASPERGVAALATILGAAAAILARSWARLLPSSQFSRFVMVPRALGKNTSAFAKGERELEVAVISRALKAGHFSVLETSSGRRRSRWRLADGSLVIWHRPRHGKAGRYVPAEITIFTPPAGSVDVHRRFKGQFLQAIDEVRMQVTERPPAAVTAKAA